MLDNPKNLCYNKSTKKEKEVLPMKESVFGWFIVTVIVNWSFVKFAIMAFKDREKYKRENEEYWEEHGWN